MRPESRAPPKHQLRCDSLTAGMGGQGRSGRRGRSNCSRNGNGIAPPKTSPDTTAPGARLTEPPIVARSPSTTAVSSSEIDPPKTATLPCTVPAIVALPPKTATSPLTTLPSSSVADPPRTTRLPSTSSPSDSTNACPITRRSPPVGSCAHTAGVNRIRIANTSMDNCASFRFMVLPSPDTLDYGTRTLSQSTGRRAASHSHNPNNNPVTTR